jgi:hypothetical protein
MKGQRLIIRNNGITKIIINYQNLNDFSLRNGVILNPNQIRHIWCVKGTFTHTFGALEIISNIDWPPVKSVRKSPTPTPTITPTPTNTPTPTITPTNTPTPTQLPLSLNLTFDNITNADILVGDSTNVADWNTFFDLPTNGNPFINVEVSGNTVNLIGGSNIIIKDNLFNSDIVGLIILQVNDIGGCVTTLGLSCFYYQPNMTSISFPNVVNNLNVDEDYGPFAYAYGLTYANLPSLVNVGDYLFYECQSLESAILPYDSITEFGIGMFSSCLITDAYVNQFINLEIINNDALQSCTGLISPSFSSVTSIGYYGMYDCTNLTTINLPSLTTASNHCFAYCTSLTAIDLPLLTTAGDYCFAYCTSLTTVDLPLLTTAGYGCFAYCTSLTAIDLPLLTTAGDYCFYDCTSLTTIDLPLLTTAGENCFYNCTSLTTVDLQACTDLGGTVLNNNMFYNISGETITLTVPSALMTCNSGNPDGDIQYLQANNTVTIFS